EASTPRDVPEYQVLLEARELQPGRAPAAGQHGLDFRSEEKPLVGDAVKQRLDAEMIAAQHDAAVAHVVKAEGEHAVQTLHEVETPRLVGVHQHFGVTARPEGVPVGLELGGELPVVVDLAVERDPDATVLVGERLLSGRHIDDAETGVSEPDASFAALSGAVRTAMCDRRPHPQE